MKNKRIKNGLIAVFLVLLGVGCKEVDPSLEYVEFEVELNLGEASLKTWFDIETGESLGAY